MLAFLPSFRSENLTGSLYRGRVDTLKPPPLDPPTLASMRVE